MIVALSGFSWRFIGSANIATHLSNPEDSDTLNGDLHVATIAERAAGVMSSKITMLKKAMLATRFFASRSLDLHEKNHLRSRTRRALNSARSAHRRQPPPHVFQSVAGSRAAGRGGNIFRFFPNRKTAAVILQGQFKRPFLQR